MTSTDTSRSVEVTHISMEELRRQVTEVLDKYNLDTDEFLRTDIDELETVELRDLWLMTNGALLPLS